MSLPSQTFKTNAKLFAVALTLLTANLTACKSSVDQDIAPEITTTEVATDTATLTTAGSTTSAAYVSTSLNFINNATLKGSFPFPIGTAVVKERLDDPNYVKVLTRDFNSITSESNMQFKAVHPTADSWTFKKADACVDFAMAHNMRIHGQTLLYPKDSLMPKFVMDFKGDKTAWKKLMQTHIQTIASRYKGRVKAWDVLNEAILDNGSFRDNIWLRKIGPDYFALAYKYAHEADPNAILFYNDYGQEYAPKKLAKILEMVGQAKKAGIPIGGLSFQLHTVLRVDVKTIANMLKQAAAAGVQVYISELDISVRYQKPDTFPLDATLANEHAAKIKAIVKAYMENVPKKQQYGISNWGIADSDSFWNVKYPNKDHDYPLMYDAKYNPKPAYKGFLEAGQGK